MLVCSIFSKLVTNDNLGLGEVITLNFAIAMSDRHSLVHLISCIGHDDVVWGCIGDGEK